MPSHREYLDRFLKNPWASGAAWLFSIVALPLAIFTWTDSIRSRKLCYLVHPVRTIVLNAQGATGLTVTHKGQELKGDLTAAQISIWNAGNESIRSTNILESVRLVSNPPVQIIEAQIQKHSRDLCGASLDVAKAASGIIGLNWAILENNDGVIVQVIYQGTPDVSFSVLGVLEGQKSVNVVSHVGSIKSPSQQLAEQSSRGPWGVTLVVLFLGSFFLYYPIAALGKGVSFTRGAFVLVIIGVLVWFLGKILVAAWTTPSPPFGIS